MIIGRERVCGLGRAGPQMNGPGPRYRAGLEPGLKRAEMGRAHIGPQVAYRSRTILTPLYITLISLQFQIKIVYLFQTFTQFINHIT